LSRLVLEFLVPDKWSRNDMQDIVRAITSQVNHLSEGKLSARYQAQSTVPSGSAVAYAVGDITWATSPTVIGSIAPGVAASYVRIGWICTAAGKPGTHQELRIAVGT